MIWLSAMLEKYPELAVFAALGIGFRIGNWRIAGFRFGGVTGSLLAGILVGWLFEVPVQAPERSMVFLLLLFGALGVILFCVAIAPRLPRLDLPKEALSLERKQGIRRIEGGYKSTWQPH